MTSLAAWLPSRLTRSLMHVMCCAPSRPDCFHPYESTIMELPDGGVVAAVREAKEKGVLFSQGERQFFILH